VIKCPKDGRELQPAYTRQGVEIESCPDCGGIWLDRDKIYHFTKIPTYLRTKLAEALAVAKPSERRSPSSGEPMVELVLFDDEVRVDYCVQSQGIWFDKEEIEKFPIDKILLAVDPKVGDIERTVSAPPRGAVMPLVALPNLFLSSVTVLFGMYAVVTGFLILVSLFTGLTAGGAVLIGFAVAMLQFLFSPIMTDWTLQWLYRLRWVEPAELPAHLRAFMAEVAGKQNIRIPRVGVIDDGAPQAFTYGHHPNNARVVISRGLMELLEPQELESVVAHEMGHIVHWDMLVMTAAQLVPLVLYYIYRTLIRMRSRGRDKSAGYRYMIAIGAYILYIISEYVVLWFSRIREYYADRFSGETTGKPEELASALVKIGYGLAGQKPDEGSKERASSDAVGLQPLGIFDSKSANILAITSEGGGTMGGKIDVQAVKDAAKWDLWNPWAGYYELQSTHPLIAKRLMMLSNLGQSLGRAPYIDFNEERPESYWDDFFFDAFVLFLPSITFFAGLIYLFVGMRNDRFYADGGGYHYLPLFVLLFGVSYLVKVLYSYNSQDFAAMNIRALLKKVKVSAVQPVPCVVKGKIIGRGVPGLLFSEDFILQDETGIIFLDYQQPLAFIDFFFGLLRAGRYQGQEVTVTGWYRRSPVPYIEIKQLRSGTDTSFCYTYYAKIAVAALLIVAGVFGFIAML
jgi:Zn-dependent protease with chaperone function/Zn-finger nucleic acid-binding protein